MELGEKLLKARQEAGLSQRQLCGDTITRNMLSQIEHGTAKPSMATLQYLAARLGKSVSFFLEEETVSPNQVLMDHARRAFRGGNWEEARTVLAGFRGPDEHFELEYRYLTASTALMAAKAAIQGGKTIYARELLTDSGDKTADFPGLERQRLLLLGSIADRGLEELCRKLPDLDEELALRARAAMAAQNWPRALALLDAQEHTQTSRNQLLRGQILIEMGQYSRAVDCLKAAEQKNSDQAIPLLERCFRELGDFKQAYLYACKQRDKL